MPPARWIFGRNSYLRGHRPCTLPSVVVEPKCTCQHRVASPRSALDPLPRPDHFCWKPPSGPSNLDRPHARLERCSPLESAGRARPCRGRFCPVRPQSTPRVDPHRAARADFGPWSPESRVPHQCRARYPCNAGSSALPPRVASRSCATSLHDPAFSGRRSAPSWRGRRCARGRGAIPRPLRCFPSSNAAPQSQPRRSRAHLRSSQRRRARGGDRVGISRNVAPRAHDPR